MGLGKALCSHTKNEYEAEPRWRPGSERNSGFGGWVSMWPACWGLQRLQCHRLVLHLICVR